MRLKFYTIIAAFALNTVVAFGQQPPSTNTGWCGTRGLTQWFDWYRVHRDEVAQARGGDTAWLYVPVTIQITGTDNGSGYYPLEQALLSVCQMNQDYVPAHIRFYMKPDDPVRYLNSTYWHSHQWEGGQDLIESNKLPDRLNIFVVADPAGNCGYSWLDAVVMSKNCSGPGNRTWSHEAGHHFSLPHPFFGWEGFTWDYTQPAPETLGTGPGAAQVEKTDGSNCYTSGDFFCDTDPDYLNYRWQCDGQKESTVLEHDPNGVPFRSDGTLIMGYSYDECGARFTEEQIAAMRANLQDPNGHASYLQVTEPGPELPDDAIVELASPIDSQTVHYNNITLSWNPVPNATFYTVEIGLFANFSPRLYYQTTINGATTVNVTKGIPNNRLIYWRVRPYNNWDLCQPVGTQQVGVFRTKNFSATNDLESEVIAELSPNPVTTGLPAELLLTSEENMEAQLSVTDAAGRQCMRQTVRLSFGENMIEIPTDGLQAGFYIITLQNAKGTILKRLAVTN